jgi:hypothetical protein
MKFNKKSLQRLESYYTLTDGRTDIAKMAVFWDVVPSSLVETNRRFSGDYGCNCQ